MKRALAVLGALLLLFVFGAPAQAATAIYYASDGNSYGWCAGYGPEKSESCAKDQCVQNNGKDCKLAVECSTGYGATAFAAGSIEGFGASCGMSDAFWARIVALDECIEASKTLCWTDSAFDARGNAQSKAANHRFDVVYYIQTMLQVRNYKPGSTDGQIGGQTIAAVKQLQADLGRDQTGVLDDELVDRLYDAIDGGPQLAVVVKRDFLDPKANEIGDAGFGSANNAPTTTYTQQLVDGPADRRLLAVAAMLATAGTKCAVPAVDAEVLGDPANETWNINCGDSWYTLVMSGGTRTIATGKSIVTTGDDKGDATTDDIGSKQATGKGTSTDNDNVTPPSDDTSTDGDRDVTAIHH